MKAKPQALTVAELEKASEQVRYLLLLAHRTNSTARGDLPALLAAGDDIAIAQCRREISESAAQVQELGASAASYNEAIESAKARDRAVFDSDRLRKLETRAAAMVRDHTNLEEAIATFSAALAAARSSAEAFEIELQRCNVTYDRYSSRSVRLMSTVEVCLWLETGGVFGRGPGLDTPMQLRESGRASLKSAAREFRGVTLRSARLTLGFSDQPDEAA